MACATVTRRAADGLIRERAGGTARIRLKTAGIERCHRHAARRAAGPLASKLSVARAGIRGDDTIEPEHRHQLLAVVGGEFAGELHRRRVLSAARSAPVSPLSARRTAPRLPSTLSLACASGACALDGQLGVQLGRRHRRGAAAQRVGGFRRKARQQRRHRRHVAGIEVDVDAALRRRRRGDAAARRKRGAAEIGDRKPIDLQATAIDLEPRAHVARVEAGDGGVADIGGDRHVVRPRDVGAGQQRLAECERGVDIEVGRLERGVEPRRARAGGEDISEVAGDRLAVELGVEAIDGDLVAGKRQFAAQAQRPQLALPGGRAAFAAMRSAPSDRWS